LTPFHRRSFLALQRTLAGDQLGLFGAVEDLSGVLPGDLAEDLSDEWSTDPVPVMDPALSDKQEDLMESGALSR